MAATETPGGNAPADNVFVVTKSDTVDLPFVTRAVLVGGAGDIKVDTRGGQVGVTIPSVPVGMLPGRFTRIYSTGTTATFLTGFY